MQHHRILAWIGALLLVAIVMILFFMSTRTPERPAASLEQNLGTLNEPTVTFVDPARGPANASVTIVEFTDFTCSACASSAVNIARLQAELPNDVKHVFKAMPNEGASSRATDLAVAALCAGEQGSFWDFHDALFQVGNVDALTDQDLVNLAEALELDLNAFASCFTEQETLALVERSFNEGLMLELTATPTIFINGERFTGAVDYDRLEGLVREMLLILD
ncbi:MAG: thioredoxin domain-containing protein [Candidatus Uhrbacteria bacterium]|nr:DsbA family protein [Patescibacteria group bacterium]MBU1907087.1 DsbA family protein [Patescibacteria group bacterium]